MIKKSFGLKWSIDSQKHTHVDSKFWTHAKTFLKYPQLQERQIFRKFEFYPASTFAKIQIQIQIQKKTLPYKNLITPMLPLFLLFLPFSWLNFQFYFKKNQLIFCSLQSQLLFSPFCYWINILSDRNSLFGTCNAMSFYHARGNLSREENASRRLATSMVCHSINNWYNKQ